MARELAVDPQLMPNLDRAVILQDAKPFDPLTHLEDLAARFPRAMQILRIGGVHPTEVIHMVNPYTGELDTESFTNTGEHCLAVACFAGAFGRILQERGLITITEADEITEKGVNHDINKRIEVLRKKAAKAGILPAGDVYSPRGYATIAPILLAQGYDEETIEYIGRAGQETGHTSFKDFLTLQDGLPALVPGKMIDKIVHLADDMTSTSIPKEEGERAMTIYLTPWERMVASEFPTRYQFMWTEGLGFDPERKVVGVKDVATAEKNVRWVKNFMTWQPWISNRICQELQTMLDPENKQRPEYWAKDLVNRELGVEQ